MISREEALDAWDEVEVTLGRPMSLAEVIDHLRTKTAFSRLPSDAKWRLEAKAIIALASKKGGLISSHVSTTSARILNGLFVGEESNKLRPTERDIITEAGRLGHWGKVISSVHYDQCSYALIDRDVEFTPTEMWDAIHSVMAARKAA